MSKDRYAEAGVDIERAERIVSRHAPHINATIPTGFHLALGGFGASVAVSDLEEVSPPAEMVLVSTTDGVGTKVELAHEEGLHEGIGEDCVAMCTNDVWAMGAEPLWFMDYIGMNRLDESRVDALMRGMSRACQRERCMLVGGETAEMPGTYVREEGYELVGFCVGGMRRGKTWDDEANKGDWVVCMASSGMHSNGFSLVRRGAELGELDLLAEMSGGMTLRRALLEPTRQYGEVLRLWRGSEGAPGIKRAAHVTGGGLERAFERLCGAPMREREWRRDVEPESMAYVRTQMGLGWEQGAQVWNMGVGFMVLCDGRIEKADLETWCETLSREVGFSVWAQGRL